MKFITSKRYVIEAYATDGIVLVRDNNNECRNAKVLDIENTRAKVSVTLDSGAKINEWINF